MRDLIWLLQAQMRRRTTSADPGKTLEAIMRARSDFV